LKKKWSWARNKNHSVYTDCALLSVYRTQWVHVRCRLQLRLNRVCTKNTYPVTTRVTKADNMLLAVWVSWPMGGRIGVEIAEENTIFLSNHCGVDRRKKHTDLPRSVVIGIIHDKIFSRVSAMRNSNNYTLTAIFVPILCATVTATYSDSHRGLVTG